ncbi:MAG: peptide deformylase [Synergistales bacterium]|nr:peptide deformylase [Synergistales bacterium]
MAVLPLKIYPDPVLRAENAEEEGFGEELAAFLEDMWESMYAHDGVGLAAPQIGVSRRIAVVEVKGERFVLIDPEVREQSGEIVAEEGCLSFPGIFEDIARPAQVVVATRDPDGTERRIDAEGFLARALMHEIDHLNGTLIIDHLSLMKRQVIKRKFRKKKG